MPKNKKTRHILPHEEWPYEVPGNWIWTQGASIFLPMEAQKPSGDFFSYIDIESIDNASQMVRAPKRVATQGAPSRANRKLHTGDTIFSLVRPYLRNIAYIDEPLSDCIASTGFFVCHPIAGLNSRYVYWLMTSDYTVIGLNQHMKGDNSPSIRKGDIEKFSFPLPPLPEQQRIVTRIESLFDKLDAAEGRIKDALEKSERLRASVLHLAFTGELTKKWREDHGVGMESWREYELNKVCKSIFDGDHMPPPKSESGIPFLVISNLSKGYLSFEDTRFVTKQYYQNLTETRKPSEGDILYTLVGSFGISVLVDTKRPFCFQRHMALLKPNPEQVESKFLWRLLQADYTYQQAKEIATGTAQLTVPIKGLRKICVTIPTLPEQQEIVRILDTVFDNQKRVKEIAEQNLARIARMKKSLLSLAFRGQLGTNNPAEESMESMLLASS